MLGTRWTVGDTQRTVRNVLYRLLRLCRPGSADWYPTAEEKDAASARKDGVIEEQDETIGEQDAALQALRDWLEARDIDPEAILRAENGRVRGVGMIFKWSGTRIRRAAWR